MGRAGEARADLDWLAGRRASFWHRPLLSWAAEACVALGDRELAAPLAEALAPVAHRMHLWAPMALICEAPLAHPLARLYTMLGRRDEAERAYAQALALLDGFDAPPLRARVEADRAQDLGTHGATATPAPARPAPPAFVLRRDGDFWTVAFDTTFRLRDSRGLQILAVLVAEPGREFHATDLLAPPGETGRLEDAGEMLDAEAMAAYRRRLEDLRDAQLEAEQLQDPARAARVRAEIEMLGAELARGVGLGGRSRKASSSAERARINVRQRLQDAIARIAEHSPALGKHLRQALRTGGFCCYDP
jgi:tetratricopeptide (TPR) repeat protein